MGTIILTLEPNAIVAVNNPVVFKVMANPLSEVHSVVMAISIFDSAINNYKLITSWEQRPDLGPYGLFTFNVEQIMQEQLSYTIHEPNDWGAYYPPTTVAKFKVAFLGYRYAGASRFVSTGLIERFIVGINAALQYTEPNLDRYFVKNENQGTYLTNGPKQRDIRPNESETLAALTDGTQGSFQLKIVGYDKYGNPYTSTQSLTDFVSKKRVEVAIGTSNLAAQNPLFLQDKVKYDVILEPPQKNFFVDGDEGNFNQNIDNINPGPSVLLQQNTSRMKSGSGSLKMGLYDDVVNIQTAWITDTQYALLPNTQYAFTAFVYVEDLDVQSWGLLLDVDGFSDATLQLGSQGILFSKIFHNGIRNQYFNKWLLLGLPFKTGNDIHGQFKMQFTGTMSTLNVYVDEVSLTGLIESAKMTYMVKPSCGNETRVHFLNRLGAMESYTFTGTEKRNIKTESSSYEKLKPVVYTPHARGRQVLQKTASVRLSCSSDALRPDEMLWLEELLTSPTVYIQRDGINVPVILRDGEFEVLDPVKNIHRLRVELEYANNLNLQRG